MNNFKHLNLSGVFEMRDPDGVTYVYGSIEECVRHAIFMGYSGREVLITDGETGEVLDIEWTIEIRSYHTERVLDSTHKIPC